MNKHTPAPWETIINPISLDLEVWNDKDCICVVDGDDKANAKLIATAPELLEALERALHDFRNMTWTDETYNIIEATIKKATL